MAARGGGDDDGGECGGGGGLFGGVSQDDGGGLFDFSQGQGQQDTVATAAKRSRESAAPEHAFKTPRTTVAGSSGSSAAAIEGLLAQLRANILALKATDPSCIDEAQLMSARAARHLLGSFINGVEAQQEAIRNPPPAETPLNFDDMVHTLSFLDCKSLAAAAAVSRHWRRAAPETAKFRLNHLSGAQSCFAFPSHQPPTAQLLAQVE